MWGPTFDAAVRRALVSQQSPPRNLAHAVFLSDCSYHCYLWSTGRIGTRTPAQAFTEWYKNAGAVERVMHDNISFPCPGCCLSSVCPLGPNGSVAT